ncbi:unnamed protein product [Mycena citricolor]|uniref:Uncharacterized protein n=1 Tax=Mycena citricolor TaxID=2018698 RepID=A0AAD2Q4Y4_9AGAR|nr:unnamed protein product [Mycena citricolor]
MEAAGALDELTMRWQNRMDRAGNGAYQDVQYFWVSNAFDSLVLNDNLGQGTPWSFVKVLFFMNRYFTFVLVIFSVFCLMWAKFDVFASLFGAFMVEVIMQIRLHAMYGQDKRLIFVVSMFCIGELGSMVSLSITHFPAAYSGMALVAGTSTTLPFCNNIVPYNFYPYWIAFMIFDSIVFVLAARKAYVHFNSIPESSWAGHSLLRILIRDSVFYFLCNIVVFLGTTLLWRFASPGVATIANSWSLVVPSTSAGRLMLNMRAAARPKCDQISTSGLSALGSLHIGGINAKSQATTDSIREDSESMAFEAHESEDYE